MSPHTPDKNRPRHRQQVPPHGPFEDEHWLPASARPAPTREAWKGYRWWLLTLLSARPHFIVGGADHPYLLRWFLIPHNRYCNVYLHQFLRSDDDRALHDHPWPSLSILIKGQYRERLANSERHWRAPAVILRGAALRHRLVLDAPVWTVFITGRKVRQWGFWCGERGDRFVPWEQFTDPNDSGRTGPGCGD